jgi:hypothetical protein
MVSDQNYQFMWSEIYSLLHESIHFHLREEKRIENPFDRRESKGYRDALSDFFSEMTRIQTQHHR